MNNQVAEQLRWALKPIQHILDDPTITDIHLHGANGPDTPVFMKRQGKREPTMVNLSRLQLDAIAQHAAVLNRSQITERMPSSPGRFPDGQRAHIVLASADAEDKTAISIRRTSAVSPSPEDLRRFGVFEKTVAAEHAPEREGVRELLAMKDAGATEAFLSYAFANGFSGVFCGVVNSGKAQPNESPVLTPTGFRPIGSLSVGDLIVTPDGKVVPVNGVFPQGKKKIYKVTFGDGRSTECCDEHLWKVQINNVKWRVKSLNEIIEILAPDNRRSRSLRVPVVEPFAIEQAPQSLAIPPYVMGAILGDGCFRARYVGLTTADTHIVERVRSEMPEMVLLETGWNRGLDYRFATVDRVKGKRGLLRPSLIRMGLMGHMSHEKFIPDEYKRGSVAQRIALLQGLLDTDGEVNDGGILGVFSTTSPRLAEDVREVLWSVGAVAKCSERQTYFTGSCGTKKAGRKSYRIYISHPDISSLFSLPRKVEKCRKKVKKYPLKLSSVEFVGEKEATCISVDHPDHLYITNNYIVTHNTYNMRAFFRCIPEDKRIITIQDMHELPGMPQEDVVHMIYPKGSGTVAQHTAENCLEWALRMDMDEIVNGEVRDGAAWALMRAGASGHPFKTTCHASSALGAFDALLMMAKQHPDAKTLDTDDIRQSLRMLIDFVAYCEVVDGKRRITQLWFDPHSKKGMAKQLMKEAA